MRLSALQKVLWGLAAIAIVGFVWLQVSTRVEQRAYEPAFRADFELTDHNGMVQTDEYLAGRWMLVFFGFANCPDVCPTTLAEVAAVMDGLGSDATQVQPLFISIDPKRDTVAAMAEYVSYFHPAIQGWRGSRDQTMRAAEGFRASYEKVATGGGDYTMNHTASVFMFDAEGQFAGTIDYHEPREFAVPKIRRVLARTEEETS